MEQDKKDKNNDCKDYSDKTKRKLDCCFCMTCFFYMLLLITCFYVPVYLNGALRITYTLNTKGYEHEFFNLSTT